MSEEELFDLYRELGGTPQEGDTGNMLLTRIGQLIVYAE